MLMRIAVIQGQPRAAKSFELRGDFGGELAARLPVEEYDRPEGRHIGTKETVSIHQMRHGRSGKRRPAFDQHQMQADTQGRHATRARDRVRGFRRRYHQARRGENAAAMRCFDGIVDFASGAEIVRRDDQSLQAASRRARKKWKNSTPSRKRRFIISGLTIISATMDAIFEGRK